MYCFENSPFKKEYNKETSNHSVMTTGMGPFINYVDRILRIFDPLPLFMFVRFPMILSVLNYVIHLMDHSPHNNIEYYLLYVVGYEHWDIIHLQYQSPMKYKICVTQIPDLLRK